MKTFIKMTSLNYFKVFTLYLIGGTTFLPLNFFSRDSDKYILFPVSTGQLNLQYLFPLQTVNTR